MVCYNLLHFPQHPRLEVYEQLCRETVLHADETTLQVLKEPGRSSARKSYMWLYRTSGCAKQAIVLYEYQPTRKAEHAEAFLKGFSGWLHADGYQGYHNRIEELTKLKELLDTGVISQEEFDAKKKQILGV